VPYAGDSLATLRVGLIRDGRLGRTEHGPSVVSYRNADPVGVWGRDHVRTRVLGEITAVSVVAGRGDQVHRNFPHTEARSSSASFSYTSAAANGNRLCVDGSAGMSVASMTVLPTADSIAAHGSALDALIEQAHEARRSHPCDVHFHHCPNTCRRSGVAGQRLRCRSQ
jgi:hypothetical protein